MSVIVFNLSSDAEGNAVPMLKNRGGENEKMFIRFLSLFFLPNTFFNVCSRHKKNKKVSNKDIESLFFSIV